MFVIILFIHSGSFTNDTEYRQYKWEFDILICPERLKGYWLARQINESVHNLRITTTRGSGPLKSQQEVAYKVHLFRTFFVPYLFLS
jgi:hypothetical protein